MRQWVITLLIALIVGIGAGAGGYYFGSQQANNSQPSMKMKGSMPNGKKPSGMPGNASSASSS